MTAVTEPISYARRDTAAQRVPLIFVAWFLATGMLTAVDAGVDLLLNGRSSQFSTVYRTFRYYFSEMETWEFFGSNAYEFGMCLRTLSGLILLMAAMMLLFHGRILTAGPLRALRLAAGGMLACGVFGSLQEGWIYTLTGPHWRAALSLIVTSIYAFVPGVLLVTAAIPRTYQQPAIWRRMVGVLLIAMSPLLIALVVDLYGWINGTPPWWWVAPASSGFSHMSQERLMHLQSRVTMPVHYVYRLIAVTAGVWGLLNGNGWRGWFRLTAVSYVVVLAVSAGFVVAIYVMQDLRAMITTHCVRITFDLLLCVAA